MSIDHYYGRQVTSVSPVGEEEWWIELEGGVRIDNSDPNSPRPPLEIEGEFLLNSIMSSSATILNFGHQKPPESTYEFVEQVAFNPLKYTITDPEQSEGEPVYPQRPPEAPLPIPDPWIDTLSGPPAGSDSPAAPPVSPQDEPDEAEQGSTTPDS